MLSTPSYYTRDEKTRSVLVGRNQKKIEVNSRMVLMNARAETPTSLSSLYTRERISW